MITIEMAILELSRWNFLSAYILVLLTTYIEAANFTEVTDNNVTTQTAEDKEELVCPPAAVTLPVFSLPCKAQRDCDIFGQLCCIVGGKMRCRKGVPRPTPKPVHIPLLEFIPRQCPTIPVIEILPVKNCTNDSDCWPRICCPDGQQSYCRTSLPEWEETSGFYPLRSMIPYLQCTPPPPLLFDLFPKPCRIPIDCFPNLCCQEQGKRFCRPPRKSLLAMIVTVMQRLG